MLNYLDRANKVVWGLPMLMLILGVGVYLSVRTGFAQFKLLPAALRDLARRVKERNKTEGVSSYRALCTALAATVGTGNIAGVAGAIAIGGPGAIFWMWICAFLGMMIKFAEATLSVAYRTQNKKCEWVGGPMYMIRKAIPGGKWLAGVYCFFGVVASFGVGNGTQINAVMGGIHGISEFLGWNVSGWVDVLIGCIIGLLILRMMLGGASKIGASVERLVPFAAIGYVALCAIALIGRFQNIHKAFYLILRGAICPSAITGGVIGSVFVALRVGVSRGLFTNEAGLGTAGIAHAAAEVREPVEQGLMGIIEVFLDTIVICTMTALVILCSDIPIAFGNDTGISLTMRAFCEVLGQWSMIPITVAMVCFAIATIFGWGLYGVRCAQYLFGENINKYFAVAQAGMAIISAVMGTGTIWMLAETLNGLMAIPNLIVLAYLTPQLASLIKRYNGNRLTTLQ